MAKPDTSVYAYRCIDDEDIEPVQEKPYEWQTWDHLSGDHLAEIMADRYMSNNSPDAYDCWPLTFEVFKDEASLGTFKVEMEMVPQFNASMVGDKPKCKSCDAYLDDDGSCWQCSITHENTRAEDDLTEGEAT